MIQIQQILVTNDPHTPKRELFELTLDDVNEFGETFFKPGFTADVYLTDGYSYGFVKTDKGWESCELIDKPDGAVLLGKIRHCKGTFEIALDQLLTRVNMQPSEN